MLCCPNHNLVNYRYTYRAKSILLLFVHLKFFFQLKSIFWPKYIIWDVLFAVVWNLPNTFPLYFSYKMITKAAWTSSPKIFWGVLPLTLPHPQQLDLRTFIIVRQQSWLLYNYLIFYNANFCILNNQPIYQDFAKWKHNYHLNSFSDNESSG